MKRTHSEYKRKGKIVEMSPCISVIKNNAHGLNSLTTLKLINFLKCSFMKQNDIKEKIENKRMKKLQQGKNNQRYLI